MNALDLKPYTYEGIVLGSFIPATFSQSDMMALKNSMTDDGVMTIGLPTVSGKEFIQKVKSELTNKYQYQSLKFVFNHFMSAFGELNQDMCDLESFENIARESGLIVHKMGQTKDGLYHKIVLCKR